MVFHYLLISMSTIKTIQIEFNSFDEIKDHDSLDIEMPLKEQFWGGKWAPLQINMAYVGCYMAKTIQNLIKNHIVFIKLLINGFMTQYS